MNAEEFTVAWNACGSVAEFAAKHGMTKGSASCRASQLRVAGHNVKRMPTHRVRSIADRLWAMVLKTESCWLWQGSVNKKGYGQISTCRGSRPLQAHRLSFEMHFGQVPDGLMVLHKCDNPSCVRPGHLFAGTAKQNTDDMVAKKRGHWQQNAPSKS